MKQKLALLLATGFYVGFIRGAPGTYASLLTGAAIFMTQRLAHRIVPELYVSILCLVTVLGILVSDEVSRSRGAHDPSFVVIDEIAGQLVALLFVPVTLAGTIAGIALFRVFDIWKPFGIRRLEKLKHGVGIMADDLAAGLLTCMILHAVNWCFFR
jgi:phosphatidylglycerophosphatase A